MYVCVHVSLSISYQAVVIDEDGSQVVTFPNGTRKVINTDGSVSVYFFNGDNKQIKPDNTVVFNNLLILNTKYICYRFIIMLNQIQLTLHSLMD